MNPIYRDMPTTIFEAISMRARKTGAINLGQGFPDGPRNHAVINAACDALQHRSNQARRWFGCPNWASSVTTVSSEVLVAHLASLATRRYTGRSRWTYPTLYRSLDARASCSQL